ncbi:MAG: ABC transporter permease [Acidimicrobiales bacterium]
MTVPGSPDVATIYERGYRRYDGPRTGVRGAVRSLVVHSLRHAVGLGRSARHKVVALAIILMAYIPAVIIVGAVAILPITQEFLPSYAEYYGTVAATLYLLAGFAAPELLCRDRRTGMLGVYLASPLTRLTYLVGKGTAMVIMMLTVTFGPPLLLLLAHTLQGIGPDGFGNWLEVLWIMIVAGIVIGGLYALIAMAVSASTDRVVVATAAILALIPGSGLVTDALVLEAGLSPQLRLLNLLFLPRALVYRLYHDTGGWPSATNPTWSLWLAILAWAALAVAWIWFCYRRLQVRR